MSVQKANEDGIKEGSKQVERRRKREEEGRLEGTTYITSFLLPSPEHPAAARAVVRVVSAAAASLPPPMRSCAFPTVEGERTSGRGASESVELRVLGRRRVSVS